MTDKLEMVIEEALDKILISLDGAHDSTRREMEGSSIDPEVYKRAMSRIDVVRTVFTKAREELMEELR